MASTRFISNLHRFSVVPFFPVFMAKFGIGHAQVGLLLSSFLGSYALSQILTGYIADRYGGKKLLSIGLLLYGIFSFLFATSLNFVHVLVFRLLMGIANAAVFSSNIHIIVSTIEWKERGGAFGVFEASASLGGIFALLGLPLLSEIVGVDMSFIFASFLCFLNLFLVLIIFIPREKQTQEGKISIGKMKKIIVEEKIWYLCGISILQIFVLYGFFSWLPTYLNTEIGFSIVEAGAIVSVSRFTALIFHPIAGKISDILGKRTPILFIGSSMYAIACLMLLFFRNLDMLLVINFLFGLGLSFTLTPFLSLSTELFEPGVTSTVTGLAVTSGQISSALSSTVLGYIIDFTGEFSYIWQICMLLAIIHGILVITLKKHEKTATRTENTTSKI